MVHNQGNFHKNSDIHNINIWIIVKDQLSVSRFQKIMLALKYSMVYHEDSYDEQKDSS